MDIPVFSFVSNFIFLERQYLKISEIKKFPLVHCCKISAPHTAFPEVFCLVWRRGLCYVYGPGLHLLLHSSHRLTQGLCCFTSEQLQQPQHLHCTGEPTRLVLCSLNPSEAQRCSHLLEAEA